MLESRFRWRYTFGYEYSWLIERIRQNNRSLTIESALSLAIDEVPGDFVLKPFLMMNKSEVSTMLLTEYNEAEVMELFKEDGRKEGREKLLISQVYKKLKRGKQPQEIADEVEESVETVNEIIEAIESLHDEEYDDQKVLEAWKQSIK